VCAAAGIAAAAALAGELLAQQQPVFRNRTDFVRVDVVVTDDDDRPITDLAIDEFEIRQGGRRQAITDFEFVSIPNASRTLDVEGVVPPPPDVASNDAPPIDSRAFVMIIDDRHLLTHDIPRVKRVVRDFVQGLAPDDEIAIVFSGRSDLSVDFTRDVARLLKTVESVGAAFGFGLDSRGPSQNPNAFAVAQASIKGLRNVVQSLVSSEHARRALVLVSGGYTIDPLAPIGSGENEQGLNMMLDLMALYDEAARANVPIYTLDPRGVVIEDMAVSDLQWLETGTPRVREMKRAEVRRRVAIQQDRLFEIAAHTGGRAFVKRNDLTAAVEQLLADNGSFYLLGYYPEPYEEDGKFHEIDVRVTRPGVRVRARQGYVAPTPAGEIVDAGASFADALGEGLPASGLRLRALVTPLGAGAEGRVTTGLTVQVTYEARDLVNGPSDERLRFAVLALDPDARIRMSDDRTFSFSLPATASGTATMEINHVVDLPRGPSALRLGVASRATGRTGTVHLPVDLPDLEDDELALGGIVVGAAAASTKARTASPEFQALLPFPPAIAREFAAADTLAVFIRVFPPSNAGAQLQTALTIARGGNVLQAAAVRCTPSSSTPGALDCIADVSLDRLAPGDYALTFAARIGAGEPVSRAIPFTVR
jgi:VWFA-related protein